MFSQRDSETALMLQRLADGSLVLQLLSSVKLRARLFPSDTNSRGAQNNAQNLRLQHRWLNGVNRFCARGILCFWSRCAWRLSAPSLPPLLCVTVMDRWLTIQAFNNCNLLLDNITFSPTHCEQPLLLGSSFRGISVLLCCCMMSIKMMFPAWKDPFCFGKSICRQAFPSFPRKQCANMRPCGTNSSDWTFSFYFILFILLFFPYFLTFPPLKSSPCPSCWGSMERRVHARRPRHPCGVVRRLSPVSTATSFAPVSLDLTKSHNQIIIDCWWRQQPSHIKGEGWAHLWPWKCKDVTNH